MYLYIELFRNYLFIPIFIRCYNCGDFANHIAAKCTQGPLPKRCHSCKSINHLIAECPKTQSKETTNKSTKSPRKKTERQKSRPKSKLEEGSANDEQSKPNLNGDDVNDKNENDN